MDVKSNLLSLAQADVEVSEMILGTTNDEISALSGTLGRIKDVSVKSMQTSV